MFFKKSKVKADVERLEHELRNLHVNTMKFSITSSEKDRMKSHLMTVLRKGPDFEYLPSRLHRLALRIGLIARPQHIPKWSLFMIRERVLEYAESTNRLKGLNAYQHGRFFRPVVSAFVLVLFVLTTVLIFPFQIPYTRASEAVFDRINGDVFVFRDDVMLKAETDMALKEGDAIMTRGASSATIRFLNNSVSRLSENTQLELRRLTRLPLLSSALNIEMFVHEGRVWSKVFHVSDETRFIVDTSRLAAVAGKKAAFDVYETPDSTELAVFDNIVQVTTVKATVDVPKTVVAGYTAQVGDDEGSAIKIDVLPKHEISRRESSSWVAENLIDDEEYEKVLVQEKEDMLASNEWSDLKGVSQPLLDSTAEVLRQDFFDAYKGFVRSQTHYMRGTKIEALAELKDFEKKVGDVLVKMNGMDEAQSQQLLAIMADRVDSQLDDYANFQSGHKLYAAKEALQDLQLKLASNAVEKASIALNQAEGMLLEIEQLSSENKLGFSASLLKKYQRRTDDFMSILSVYSSLDPEVHFGELITEQADQMKLLTAVEQSLVYGDQQSFRDQVRDVRQETLRKFVLALDQLPYAVPQETLYEVKDLYDMYGQKGSAEEEMIQPALNKYLAQDYQISFIDPSGVTPEDMEILPLADALEATADVQQEERITDDI